LFVYHKFDVLAAGVLIKHIVKDTLHRHDMGASFEAGGKGVASAVPVGVFECYSVVVVITSELNLSCLEVDTARFLLVPFGFLDLSV
jgi:hypothetical protein